MMAEPNLSTLRTVALAGIIVAGILVLLSLAVLTRSVSVGVIALAINGSIAAFAYIARDALAKGNTAKAKQPAFLAAVIAAVAAVISLGFNDVIGLLLGGAVAGAMGYIWYQLK
jgi:hypothetical protein